MSEIEG
jgi:Ca2+-binding EF-hand superfamily protein